MLIDPASFRDPDSQVVIADGRIFRLLSARGAENLDAIARCGLLDTLRQREWIQPFEPAELDVTAVSAVKPAMVVEQKPIPFITYPYEWSFSLLQAAALLHLDIQIAALKQNFSLVDASAFNVQFIGPRPVFIDLTSFRPYREGEYWLGHQQFLNQFLNPLLLAAFVGVPFAPWFRGGIAGIPTSDLHRLIPFHRRLSWRMLTNVELPAFFQRQALNKSKSGLDPTKQRSFPRSAYEAMLTQLRDWIAALALNAKVSPWSRYERQNTYSDEGHRQKREFVEKFISEYRPATVWDMGCNKGEYAELAIRSGANRVVGFDSDLEVLEASFRRAVHERLNFLPLCFDASNPSPNQGWAQTERKGIWERRNADMVLALAFLHHLVIGSTVPLRAAVAWLVDLAPRGIIEFVTKQDSTVREMLSTREDIFHDYTEQRFAQILLEKAKVVAERRIQNGSRILFAFEKR
jgi:ribosomal protein L11 methylase PrmA